MTAPDLTYTLDIVARTLWGEARGEGREGQEAIANVIMNRVVRARARQGGWWWGSDPVAVCRKPWQFSCWNPNDPNRRKLDWVSAKDPIFARCLAIAKRALAGELPDRTRGATHYHEQSLAPPWSLGRTPTTQIGRHVFYADIF